MAPHDYSPSEALALLFEQIEKGSPELASNLRAAIDAGKDVWESKTFVGSEKPKKYRKAVRLSDEEALRVVIRALRAHFVEHPLLTTSAVSEFAHASLDASATPHAQSPTERRPASFGEHDPIEKKIEIELQTETRVLPRDKKTAQLLSTDKEMIEDQKRTINRLFQMTDFNSR